MHILLLIVLLGVSRDLLLSYHTMVELCFLFCLSYTI